MKSPNVPMPASIIRGRLLVAALAVVTLLGSVPELWAQAQDPLAYVMQTGIPEFTTAQSVELGFVSLSNGNLHQEIDLGSPLLQRGNLPPFTAKLVYDSRIWTWESSQIQGVASMWALVTPLSGNPFCTSTAANGLGCGGWRFMTTADPGSVEPIGHFETCGDYQFWQTDSFIWTSPEGTTRHFAAHTQTGEPGCWGDVAQSAAYADDGSGYFMSVVNYNQATVYAPDGTQIFPGLKDTNGNFYSYDTAGNVVADTIGRTPVITTMNCNNQANVVCYDILNSQGSRSRYTVTTAQIDVCTNFGPTGQYCTPAPNLNRVTVIQSIALPNQTSYTFSYDAGTAAGNYGLLTGITLPTGGQISYSYTTFTDATAPSLNSQNRWVNTYTSGGGQWTFAPNVITFCQTPTFSCQQQMTLTKPGGDQAVFTFALALPYNEILNTTAQYYTGAASGTPLVTVQHGYQSFHTRLGNPYSLPQSVTVTVPGTSGNLVKQTTYSYDTFQFGVGAPDTIATGEKLKTKSEYDFGGALLRTTVYTYQDDSNSAYRARNIINRRTSETVCTAAGTDSACNGAGTVAAQTVNEYDNYTQALGASGATQHDPAYGTSYGTRANITAVSRWRNTDGALLTTRNQYDDAGNIVSTTDPLNHTTSFDHTDSWSNATCAPAPASGQAAAYVTKATNALGQIARSTYNSCTGTVASTTDANNQTTNFSYDSMDRHIQTLFPPDASGQRGETDVTYNDSALPANVTTTTKITSSLSTVSIAVLDGLGRTKQTHFVDPEGDDFVETTYDPNGRVASVTNPYRSFSDSTFGLTSHAYDALGRTTDVVKADGSVVHTDYSGNVTTVTDEAGHTRRSTVDALGRMTEVDEPGASNALGTPGAVARVSGSISGHVQMDPAVLSAVLQTINTLLLTDSSGTTTSTTAPAATSPSAPSSPSTSNSPSPAPAEAITNAPAATAASAPANPNYDTGKVWLWIKGFRATAYYQQGSTAGSIARDLASQFNVGGSPVFARVDGDSQLILLSRIPGTAGNLTVDDQGTQSDNPSKYPNPSFTISMSPSNWSNAAPGDLSSPLVTLYQYDALGNLLRVDQKGTAPSDSTQWRTRTFAYDSLSRLLTASNPESGTINYSYDGNGNVLQKTSPAPNQTGAATQTISYCYDQLNRVTGKAYSPQNCPLTSPAVSWAYDAGANGIGHLTSLTDQAGSASYSYDAIGRIKAESRTIAGAAKSMSYLYNLDGSIQSITYPSTATITYTPDAAGRMLSAIDNGNGINYVTGATYSPGDLLTGFVSGNSGITNSFSFNQRLQPVSMSAASPTQTLFSLTYDFHFGAGDNGNVFAISNNKDTTRSRSFTYDALNRLSSAQNAGTDCTVQLPDGHTKFWGNNYGYDAWGNLLSKSPTKCTPESMSVIALANNQLSGYGYDAAGNMTSGHMNSDPIDVVTATYDAENRIATATSSKKGTTTNYTYDADGNRIGKASGTTGTLYWYMSLGIVGESDLSGNLQSEYVFFDGERVARKDFPSGSVSYYFSDHLKTTDVVTDAQGTIKNESDFYPWGSELQFANGDSNHYKFTGKERDNETSLDYFGARYYSNQLGRFITPDPRGSLQPDNNPQTLNLYAYVFNNPLRFIDEKGFSAADRVNRAAAQVGKPYGGKGPDSFDCSGLAAYSVGQDVPGLPISAVKQYEFANSQGDFTTDPGQVQPGDEVFFADKDGTVVHVGVVESVDQKTGAITMIEASGHKYGVVRKTITHTKAGSQWGQKDPEWIKGYGLWHNFDQGAHSQTANNGGWWSRIVNYWSPLWYIAPAPPPSKPNPEGHVKRHKRKDSPKDHPCLKNRADGTCVP